MSDHDALERVITMAWRAHRFAGRSVAASAMIILAFIEGPPFADAKATQRRRLAS